VDAVPYLAYNDAPSAIDFLHSAFGFEVAYRNDLPDGGVGHAELSLGDARVMLSTSYPDAGVHPPIELGGVHTSVWCEVDDVDAHYVHARDAGAVVIGPPTDQSFPFRVYQAIDPEGHRWQFGSAL
jgi:PhnB protein